MTDPAAGADSRARGDGKKVLCPICLTRLDWDKLPLYRFDFDKGDFVELRIPPDAGPEQRAKLMVTAQVRCPSRQPRQHHLPAAYGEYGPPLVYGLVGESSAGKTHLLTAMVGALERGDLNRHYGLDVKPVDVRLHQDYLRDNVQRLIGESRLLSATRAGQVEFVDAFVIRDGDGPPRPVALFDVAGGDLTAVEDAKGFLDAADGLIFVVDPALLDKAHPRDRAISVVLGLLEATGRLADVRATVVLNKADLLRFDDPIALWLRRDAETLDPAESLRESEEIYAYLYERGAYAWTRPYQECSRATLHVVSAVGSDAVRDEGDRNRFFDRGVHPRRVLRPLVSLLAMTDVLTAPEAQLIGI